MKTQYFAGNSFDPYLNLAVEEYLMDTVDEETCILYLWQNRHTVVIGRNQHCFSECRVEALERDGGHLARRLSGGGAVYHDLGNLNFTFLMNSKHYDIARQMDVILKAVESVGIKAEKSGRNDITVDGRKFSGNAFYHRRGRSCHHGTLLIDVDGDKVSRYLSVPEDKLKAKGVRSVISRITNLKEHAPGLTIDSMKQQLLDAFTSEYGSKPDMISKEDLDQQRLVSLYGRYSSESWIYGKELDQAVSLSERFAWGGVDIRLKVCDGIIEDAAVYSDAMDADLIARLPECLRKIPASAGRMADSLDGLISGTLKRTSGNDQSSEMILDIQNMLRDKSI